MNEAAHHGCRVSTALREDDISAVHAFLTRSYWAQGISRATVARSIANSLCFAMHCDVGQVATLVGFARVVTDRTTFAYLCDVFVPEAHRGQGLAKRLMAAVQSHPELQGLRRIALVTRDAHGLYECQGFKPLAAPERWMERVVPNPYTINPSP